MRQVQSEYFSALRPTEPVYEWQKREAFVPDQDVLNETKLLAAEKQFLLDPDTSKPRYRYYEPLIEEPELFLKFARLEGKREAFAAFANQYGELGVGVRLIENHGKHRIVQGIGEPLYRWKFAHERIKLIADIVVAVRDHKVEIVRPWVRVWDTGARFEWEVTPSGYRGWELIAETKHGLRTELWNWACAAKTEDEKLLRLAAGYAQEQINKAMSGERNDNTTCSTTRLLFDVEKQTISMFLVPNTLLAAMWLQCAKGLVSETQTMGECKHCGKIFPVSGLTGRRRDAKYCSSRCKVAAHRAAKAKVSST